MQTQVVTLDVLKPIGTTVDLSDSFNARVGDKMTPFQLFITEGGVAKDLKGMHPELEAEVGNGALRNGVAVMAAGAKGVHWVGSTNNVTGYNQLTLAFPAEVFPQSGFCYGHLILANDAGVRETSVDIWFQVLDGTPLMGLVADHYDSELQLELAKAKNANNQFSQEMRDTYNQQVTEAQNALTKATANLSSLAATAGNVEAQITAQDIITRPEYNDLATKINRTLANFDIHPEVFASQADLLAKYPKGAEGLKVTVDTMHKWLYLNGAWTDKGPYTFNDLSPKEKAALYAHSSDNILINPDLQNDAYGWSITNSWEADPKHAIDNSMAYGIYLTEKPNSPGLLYQAGIPVAGHPTISVGAQILTVDALQAEMFIKFYDVNGNIVDAPWHGTSLPVNTFGHFEKIKLENIPVPKGATTIDITIAMENTGLAIVCRPQACFEAFLPQYSIREINDTRYDDNNILINPNLQNNAYGWIAGDKWVKTPSWADGNSMAYGVYLTEKPDNPITFSQIDIPIQGKSYISAGVQVTTNNELGANLQVVFRDANNEIITDHVNAVAIPANATRELVKINAISVPANAITAALTIEVEDKGVLNICRPQMVIGNALIPYSIKELANNYGDADNALTNPDLSNYAYNWSITGAWEADPMHAINNSMAYGINLSEKPQSPSLLYQEDIPIEKRSVVSAGVRVLAVNALSAIMQVLFRDENGDVIAGTDQSILLPKDTGNRYELVRLENVTVPANAKTMAFTIAMIDKGLLIVCRPQVNFQTKLVPYALSDVSQSTAGENDLPSFTFSIKRENAGDKWANTKFTYQNGGQQIEGYAQIAIQGDSSRFYDKKNYKIKTFSDADCKTKLKLRLVPSWPETNKFNLKANFIDATQSRNLASAKLVAAATAITPITDSTVESHLAKTSNFGQMEGFPIEVYFDGVYNGLYTCNTKKDDKIFGLDADEPGNAAVSVLDNVAQSDTQLLSVPTAKLDGVAYADELHDTPDPELVANWTKWLQFLNTATDDDFKANLGNYIDIKSAINLYLFGVMSREYDFPTKSVIYLTWNNGKYFYLVPYDLDSNWGQGADGRIEGNPTEDDKWGFATETSTKTDGQFISNVGWNKLFERLYKLFMPEIKEQYTYLRSNIWRTDQLLNAYRDFMNQIPQSVYEKDHALWKQIPSQSTNNFEQLHQVIVQRSNQMDRWIKSK